MTHRSSRPARWYERADRVERALLSAVDVLHQGGWLGLMGPNALHAATDLYYEGAARYVGRDYNLGGFQPWEEEAVRRHFTSARSVLIAAAGGGREAFALERRGLSVRAFDCVGALVEAANRIAAEEGLVVRLDLAAPDVVPDGLGTFDAAVIGWGGYMHIPGRATRVAFLQQLRRHLHPGAPVLLSFFERASSARRFRAVGAIATFVRRARMSSEPVELGDSLAGSFDHHFTRDELLAELEAGGFEPVEYASVPYAHAVARAARA